jgi:glycine hydroxymethyltransferase
MLALSIPNGGHISMGRRDFSGTAGTVHGLEVEYLPFDRERMTVDVDKTREKILKMSKDGRAPKLVMFGGSLFLFPMPVKELAGDLQAAGVVIGYDAAHVSGLIAGGVFQDPLREGADAMSLSTHKTLFGPQGGIVVSWEKYAEKIKKATFPANTSNHHLHSVAAKAVAFAEMLAFGHDYARQVVMNAKALAQALSERGFNVLGEKRGFTESHQVAVDVSKFGLGGDLERRLEQANIIVNRQLLPGDIQAGRHYQNPGGIRLGTSEVTRLGMRANEMAQIADFIVGVIVQNEPPDKIRSAVREFRSKFQQVHYAFETSRSAYDYVRVR